MTGLETSDPNHSSSSQGPPLWDAENREKKKEWKKDILYQTWVTLPLCSLPPIITTRRCKTIYLLLGIWTTYAWNSGYLINNSAVIILDKNIGRRVLFCMNSYHSPESFWNGIFTYLLLFLFHTSCSLVLEDLISIRIYNLIHIHIETFF